MLVGAYSAGEEGRGASCCCQGWGSRGVCLCVSERGDDSSSSPRHSLASAADMTLHDSVAVQLTAVKTSRERRHGKEFKKGEGSVSPRQTSGVEREMVARKGG